MSNTISAPIRILRRPDIEARYGLKRSTLYDAIRAGSFPRPIQLGARATGWIEAEVEAWLSARIAASRPTPAMVAA
jgi:prophage regulatory protein